MRNPRNLDRLGTFEQQKLVNSPLYDSTPTEAVNRSLAGLKTLVRLEALSLGSIGHLLETHGSCTLGNQDLFELTEVGDERLRTMLSFRSIHGNPFSCFLFTAMVC